MSRSGEMFSQLLTEGIHTIKIRQLKPIKVIQDELGYALGKEKGGVSIEYWRRGYIPSNLSDIEKLARQIVKRGDLDKAWLERFLFYAGYPNPTNLFDELFSSEAVSYVQPVTTSLPDKAYREPVGRDKVMSDILKAFNDPDGRWIVAIDGLGGIGKTALALKVAEKCAKEHLFDAVFWQSAAKKERSDSGLEAGEPFTFDYILNTIGTQLGDYDFPSLKSIAEKEQRVRSLLGHQRVLVVLDNLETAGEPQHEIAQRLRSLLMPSKALLVSRRRFQGEIYAIHMTGLSENGAIRFICQEAIEKGIKSVETARPEELRLIAGATGGSPLALKLILSQLSHLPLEIVLRRLREATIVSNKNQEDVYSRFYRSIFFSSWQQLSKNGKCLLMIMAQFVPGIGESFETVQTATGLSDNALINAIDELWQLSLLEVGEARSLRQLHYYLHALTRYFVLSNMV